MSVAIIIVNYGVAEMAVTAVQSAFDRLQSGDEIHLVDNNSPNDEGRRLAEIHAERGWGDKVTLWLEKTNHGFGEGNNVVLRALAERDTPPDFVFLLNPDASLENDVLPCLVRALDADPKAAACGAALLNSDGLPDVAAFRFPSVASEISRIIDFGPLWRLMAPYRVPMPAVLPHGIVDWVSGAAVMFRFEALRETGFFDPDFFLYYEEVDLMRRLTENGWHILHEPEAQVLHHAGGATGVRDGLERRRQPHYLYDSWRVYFSKAIGRRKALALAVALLPLAGLNICLNRLRGRTPSVPSQFFRDHWQRVIRPLFGPGETA